MFLNNSKIQNYINNIYIFSVTLTLLLHVFNILKINDDIKFFHVTAIFSIGVICLLKKRRVRSLDNFKLFIIWTLFSSLLSPISTSLFSSIKFLIVILSVYGIVFISINKLILFVNIITPFIIISLLYNYASISVYRYEGFYEDPNYLCTTLLVFYFYIQLLWKQTENNILKKFLFVEILSILFLITTTISRTGIVCFAVMTLIFYWEIIKNKVFKSILVLSLLLVCIYSIYPEFIDGIIQNYLIREIENSDDVQGAGNLRWEISMRGINYLLTYPQYLLQGIGIGGYASATSLNGWHASTSHADHNSFTSCFSEQGLIGIILYLLFLKTVYKSIKSSKILKNKGLIPICLGTFFVFLLFSASIYQLNYLPFWFLIFTLISLANNN